MTIKKVSYRLSHWVSLGLIALRREGEGLVGIGETFHHRPNVSLTRTRGTLGNLLFGF